MRNMRKSVAYYFLSLCVCITALMPLQAHAVAVGLPMATEALLGGSMAAGGMQFRNQAALTNMTSQYYHLLTAEEQAALDDYADKFNKAGAGPMTLARLSRDINTTYEIKFDPIQGLKNYYNSSLYVDMQPVSVTVACPTSDYYDLKDLSSAAGTGIGLLIGNASSTELAYPDGYAYTRLSKSSDGTVDMYASLSLKMANGRWNSVYALEGAVVSTDLGTGEMGRYRYYLYANNAGNSKVSVYFLFDSSANKFVWHYYINGLYFGHLSVNYQDAVDDFGVASVDAFIALIGGTVVPYTTYFPTSSTEKALNEDTEFKVPLVSSALIGQTPEEVRSSGGVVVPPIDPPVEEDKTLLESILGVLQSMLNKLSEQCTAIAGWYASEATFPNMTADVVTYIDAFKKKLAFDTFSQSFAAFQNMQPGYGSAPEIRIDLHALADTAQNVGAFQNTFSSEKVLLIDFSFLESDKFSFMGFTLISLIRTLLSLGMVSRTAFHVYGRIVPDHVIS